MGSVAAVVGLAFSLLLSTAVAAADDARALAARAKSLVDAREAPQAFALLEPYEGRLAGDVDFDYWLGVAAFESGHLDRAVIAFERVLVRRPDFDSARLELARTYLRMGALDVAAQEFDRLLARAPNEQGRRVIEEYQAQIARLKRRQRFSLTGFVEAGGGRDTNLSSSTQDFPGAILSSFGLPGIQPTGNSIRREDNFAAVNAGADAFYAFTPERAVFAAATARWRGYRQFDDYDYVIADLVTGMRVRAGLTDYVASLLLQSFRQDGAVVDTLGAERITNDRDAGGVNFEARRELDASTQLALGAQFTAYRYRSNPGQDTRQVVVSAAIDRKVDWYGGTTLGLRVFAGHDDARRTLNDFTDATASRLTYGARFVAQTDPSQRLSWVKAFGWSRRVDDDSFARATLVEKGRDDLLEAFVRASYRINDTLALQPYLSWVYNRSNIALYTFHKTEGGLMLRYEIR
jgi:tetratricopeptide (TPR) repeat protein